MSSEQVVFGCWLVSDIGISNRLTKKLGVEGSILAYSGQASRMALSRFKLRYSPKIRGRSQDPANGQALPCRL